MDPCHLRLSALAMLGSRTGPAVTPRISRTRDASFLVANVIGREYTFLNFHKIDKYFELGATKMKKITLLFAFGFLLVTSAKAQDTVWGRLEVITVLQRPPVVRYAEPSAQ